MKYIRLIYTIFAVCLLLCGCQKTPEEVKENMEQYGENTHVEDTKITYCSVDELKGKKISAVDAGNITISSGADFSNIEDVAVLQLSFEQNFLTENNKEKYAELFGVDKNKLQDEDAGGRDWGRGACYDNEKKRKYLYMLESGGMAYMAGSSYDNIAFDTIEKKYNTDEEDISGINIVLNDTETNLSDICKNTEQWLEEHMYIDGLHYKISDVYIRKQENNATDDRAISMWAEYEYKGIQFNGYTIPLDEYDDAYNWKTLTTTAFILLDYYENPDMPSRFSRNTNFVIDSSEPIKKVIDPDSAVSILKDTLSGFGVFHISKVLPLYVLYLKDYAEAPGAGIEARPAYAFLVEDINRKHDTDYGTGLIKTNCYEHFFFVDMETGELTTDLKKSDR